jgi:hypothetical protein
MLCAWNAYTLQVLGDQFLDADYAANPLTTGFVPPVTAAQVLGFYSQVEPWLNRAQQARSNPEYRLDVQVPAELPRWSEVEPCPNSHLHGMMAAMRSVREHAALAMAFFEEAAQRVDPVAQAVQPSTSKTGDQKAPSDEERRAGINHIRQVSAAATTKARYADDLWGGRHSRELHEQVEPHVKEAIERFYHLGQLLAMPSLAEICARQEYVPTAGSSPLSGGFNLPGQPGFDPWQLTDPVSRGRWEQDPKGRRAVAELWRYDPDPRLTLQIQAEIEAALARGDVGFATDGNGQRLGHFFCCPWGPVYVASRPLSIGGRRLRTMEQFIFDVSAEGVALGEPFKREIMVAVFHPTQKVEYGDPTAPPDH